MKEFVVYLPLLNIISNILAAEKECNSLLVTNFDQQSCTALETQTTSYYYGINKTVSCVPHCQAYKPEGHASQTCPPSCPPAYECASKCKTSKVSCKTNADCQYPLRNPCVGVCMPGSGSCMAYHANTFDFNSTYYSALKFKPKCTTSGEWEAKQCKGGVSGRCFCYDATGNRLFGQAEYHKADDMTCACVRKKAELMANGRFFVTFHCDSMGNYEELQCDSASELCWCAESKTGEPTSPIVPEKAMIKLPCYKASEIGGQYLRKCESALFATSLIENKLTERGMQYVNLGSLLCDGDGAYGAYNMSGGIARCTWRDGTQIGSWQSDASSDISTVNCNCARDFKMYSHQLTCDGAGNYNAIQTIINKDKSSFFCVDKDGYPKTNMFSERLANCSSYY